MMQFKIRLLATVLMLPTAWVFAQSVTDSNLTVTGVRTSGLTLSQPTSLTFIGPDDMLITEKASGQVKRMTGGVVSSTIAYDVPVTSNSERGLLCLVLDPQFSSNNFAYIYYTRSNTGVDSTTSSTALENRVARITWNSGTGTFSSELTVLTLPVTSGPNHDGGRLIFGPPSDPPANQKLFIIIGDLNRNGQNQNYSAGAASDDTGVIIRINPDGTTPTDNPFFSVSGANAALQRQYAYGIRNSFGLDWDTFVTPSRLWETENGPGPSPPAFDEVNFIAPGFNGGWERFMGPSTNGFTYGASSLVTFGGIGTYTEPKFSFRNAIAVTSIHFLRGGGLGPSYVGDCFVGSNNSPSTIYRFEMNLARDAFTFVNAAFSDLVYDSSSESGAVSEIAFGSGFNVVTEITTGPDGAMYVLSLGNGQVYRIRDPNLSGVNDWLMY